MKNILVTGSNGQLGIAFNDHIKDKNYYIINTDVNELNITNLEETIAFVKENKPDIIVNCAAHTAVDKCEDDVLNAYKINAIGPRNLSIAANEVNAKVVQVSTDFVFDGNSSVPYKEFDQANPISIYGKTKLEGENFVKEFSKKHFIIRTAWLYGKGNNFVKTMLKLSETKPSINVVSDQFGTPTSADELARMIIYLMDTDNYGTFHGTCEGSTSWYEFTKEIFRLANIKTQVESISTNEYPTRAKRPAYSVLDKYMLGLTTDFRMMEWKDALSIYMKSI